MPHEVASGRGCSGSRPTSSPGIAEQVPLGTPLARAGGDRLSRRSGWAGDEDRIADRVVASQARPALAAVLGRLPDRDRDVLLLVAVGGLSYAEAAFALGIPEEDRWLG